MNRCLTLLLALMATTTVAQSKLNFDSLVLAHTFPFAGTQFSGKGWDYLFEKAKRTNYVLVGEDHFTSEIPLFTQSFAERWKPDNFVCEVDPWMMRILAHKISTLSPTQLDHWVSSNYLGFSFFSKKNEFGLMTNLLKEKVRVFGIEQVGLMSTSIIYQHLIEKGSQQNRDIYEVLRDSSTAINSRSFADLSKPFFMINPFFGETMGKLTHLKMKPEEKLIVDDMLRSATIYQSGSHRARIKLMQQNLMSLYPSVLKGKKNLFKFGANHTIKGESYLPVYDIGTTAHVLAQAENQDSFHILIVPKSGQQAGFVGGVQDIDLNDGLYKSLQPLFSIAPSHEWAVIDLEAIRSAVRKLKFDLKDELLRKTIFGYDALVVIPKSTAAVSVR